jgi:flagellar biosynthesis/type III secretory pathway chaperone
MISQLKELSKLSLKANIKHHEVIEKHISHSIDLAAFIKEDRAKIDRLNNVIDMKQREIKQREIDELNTKQMDLLWELSKLEKRLAEAEKVQSEVADYEKKITKFINEESVDN